MAIDKYSQLKIAAIVLETTIGAMARELDVTTQSLKGVCDGNITSDRIEKYINKEIKASDKILAQHLRQKNLQPATI